MWDVNTPQLCAYGCQQAYQISCITSSYEIVSIDVSSTCPYKYGKLNIKNHFVDRPDIYADS